MDATEIERRRDEFERLMTLGMRRAADLSGLSEATLEQFQDRRHRRYRYVIPDDVAKRVDAGLLQVRHPSPTT